MESTPTRQSTPSESGAGGRRALEITALILAGEAIFLLPFILPRVFRPTMLAVWRLDNTDFGLAFSTYGVVAILAYFFGGPLADRIPARNLMTASLLATAAGAAVLWLGPSPLALACVYGWWGLTTILTFWAPLIRATRMWGTSTAQGRAYGLLDAGRGVTAASIATATVWIFAAWLPESELAGSVVDRTAALRAVIASFAGATALAAGFVWLALPADDPTLERDELESTRAGLRAVLAERRVWLQALLVCCAYAGYKSADDFALLARHVFGYDEVDSAGLTSLSLWIRPIAALTAGYAADRLGGLSIAAGCFGLATAGSLLIASGLFTGDPTPGVLFTTVVLVSLGVHGLRGVYFSIFKVTGVRPQHTGSAVGLVSVIGYTPDIFMGPIMGTLIDAQPDRWGHQNFFAVVAGFTVLGAITTLLIGRRAHARGENR